jgi:hypothetical protein
MGLDQYAFQRNKNTKLNGEWTEQDRDNIKYEWRKHARLQVFMRDLYRQKNPDAKMGTYNLGMNGLEKPLKRIITIFLQMMVFFGVSSGKRKAQKNTKIKISNS